MTLKLASTKNYEISGEDKFCKKPITEPRKAGEVWVDDEGILPFTARCCTLGAYADFMAKGKKIDVTYVFDTARGIKLFADQAFFAVGGEDIAPFLLKKDAEAYAAKNNGKVLGFEDAVKAAISGGKTWQPGAGASISGADDRTSPTVEGGAGAAPQRQHRRPVTIRVIAGALVPAQQGQAAQPSWSARSRWLGLSDRLAPADEISRGVLRPLHQRALAARGLRQFHPGDPRSKVLPACRVELPPHPARLLAGGAGRRAAWAW